MCICVCTDILHRCMCVFVCQSQAAFTSPSGAVLSLNSRSSAKAVPYTPGYRLALDSIGVATTPNIVAKPAAAHTPDYMLALDSIGVKAPQSSATSPTVVTSSYQAALASVGAKPISAIANSVGSTLPPAASVVGSITPAPKPLTPVFHQLFCILHSLIYSFMCLACCHKYNIQNTLCSGAVAVRDLHLLKPSALSSLRNMRAYSPCRRFR
jgi:hypothetical protein